MPTITIDGKTVDAEAGQTIMEAADAAGIDIPRYCYHPGLPIVGQCRICLVEVEKMPKLQVACYSPVSDGMIVHTGNPRVKLARQQVLEFLLVNHPIDCPVCDQAGECFLQDYYMKYGLYDSKMLEDKVKKSKALDIGKHIVLDSERCILCTRCVRFCDTISKTSELGIFNRGDHAELLPQPGKRLDNPYSVNTADICPVGALTEKDFRFKTRVWYLEVIESVCPGCSTGCNIEVHVNKKREHKNAGRRIARLKLAFNPAVNEYWMCDYGRYGFLYADADDRLTTALVRDETGQQPVDLDQVIERVAEQVREVRAKDGGIAVIGDAALTNEDLYVLRRFASEFLGTSAIPVTVTPLETPYSDDFLIRADKKPNSRGAALLGFQTGHEDTRAVLKRCAEGKVSMLFVLNGELEKGFPAKELTAALQKVATVVYIGSNQNSVSEQAHIVLPGCTCFEKDGTFTNHAGRVQRLNRAVDPLEQSLSEWQLLRKLARKLGASMAYFDAEDIFRDLAAKQPAFAGMSYASLGSGGQTVQENGRAKAGQRIEPAVVAG